MSNFSTEVKKKKERDRKRKVQKGNVRALFIVLKVSYFLVS